MSHPTTLRSLSDKAHWASSGISSHLDTDSDEERADDGCHRVAGVHPGGEEVGPVSADEVFDVWPARR
jgi:hypothetical protein